MENIVGIKMIAVQLLDRATGDYPQLSELEFLLLASSVLAAGLGPVLFGGYTTELLAPSSAAFCAAIGIGAEYAGKVAVADGKEVAAASMQVSVCACVSACPFSSLITWPRRVIAS